MTLIGYRASNHPQQVARRGRNPEVDDRATHPDVFREFDREFGPFTLDAAAAPHNTKCERFFTREDDGLAQSWAGERAWCNPPYSAIEPWVEKAWAEWPTSRGVVMLLPANRTEQGWWQRLVEPWRDKGALEVRFLPGRMRFIRADKTDIGPNERPPFGVCLLVWCGAE